MQIDFRIDDIAGSESESESGNYAFKPLVSTVIPVFGANG